MLNTIFILKFYPSFVLLITANIYNIQYGLIKNYYGSFIINFIFNVYDHVIQYDAY